MPVSGPDIGLVFENFVGLSLVVDLVLNCLLEQLQQVVQNLSLALVDCLDLAQTMGKAFENFVKPSLLVVHVLSSPLEHLP